MPALLKRRRPRADWTEMQVDRQHLRFWQGLTVSVLVTAAVAAWLAIDLGGERLTLYVDDLVTVAAALTAAVLCALAGLGQEGRMRRFWLLLAVASGAWALGEAIWAAYDLVLLREVPVPSWADIGYLGAIPIAIAALVSHPTLHQGGIRTARSVFDALLIATALLFLSWTLVLGPLWDSSDLSTVGGFVTLAYPFGDAVMIFFIVLLVRAVPSGDNLALWCLLGGLLAMALSDSTYAYLTQVKDYGAGDIIDAGWVAGYLGIALGALCGGARTAVIVRPQRSVPSLPAVVAPFLPMLVALVVVGIEVDSGNRPDRVAMIMAFALVTLVLVRQILLVWDLIAPQDGGEESVMQRLQTALLPENVGAEPTAPATAETHDSE